MRHILVRTYYNQCTLFSVDAAHRKNVLLLFVIDGKDFLQIVQLVAAFLGAQHWV